MSSMHRIGLLVPSSNTTMETEVPAAPDAPASAHGRRTTFSFQQRTPADGKT